MRWKILIPNALEEFFTKEGFKVQKVSGILDGNELEIETDKGDFLLEYSKGRWNVYRVKGEGLKELEKDSDLTGKLNEYLNNLEEEKIKDLPPIDKEALKDLDVIPSEKYDLIAEWLEAKGFDKVLVKRLLTAKEEGKEIPKGLRLYGDKMFEELNRNPIVKEALNKIGIKTDYEGEIWEIKPYVFEEDVELVDIIGGKLVEYDLVEESLGRFKVPVIKSPTGTILDVDLSVIPREQNPLWDLYFSHPMDILIAYNSTGDKFLIFKFDDGREHEWEVIEARKPQNEEERKMIEKAWKEANFYRILHPYKEIFRPDLVKKREGRDFPLPDSKTKVSLDP